MLKYIKTNFLSIYINQKNVPEKYYQSLQNITSWLFHNHQNNNEGLYIYIICNVYNI